ncbi:cbb3-type cytochrome c oxidase N-terminal domain-containing protein [Nibrella saemangeumensis]
MNLPLLQTILLSAPGSDHLFGEVKTVEDVFLAAVVGIIILVCALVLVQVIHLYLTVRELNQPAESAQAVVARPKKTFWQYFTGLVPISQEKELVMEHSYDGIQELDNPTPPWFMSLFYGTIAIGVVYLIYYHVIDTDSLQIAEYTQEVAIAEKQREEYIKKVAGNINENTVTMVADAKGLESGKTLYTQYCVACHGEQAEGKVGPNLTDEYWLHGGDIKAVFHSITEGIPDKGMISWKNQLNPLQIQQISSFVLSLKGTNPANAKEPQGTKAGEEVAAR